jgi:chemotaxis protein histidine kinase CheA
MPKSAVDSGVADHIVLLNDIQMFGINEHSLVNHNNKLVGIMVDKPLQQKEIVKKLLIRSVDNNGFISGVTIMSNGNVSLVLNILATINHVFQAGFNKRTIVYQKK